MTGAVVCGYLAGWLLTTTVAVLTASRANRPRWLSIVAGAVWPVLAVAVAQVVLIALMATLIRSTDAGPADTTKLTPDVDDTFVKTV
ncbi:hypothetical protein H7K45_21990 [Mycobacterium yunnanensis]|uniref:Uncharacterized protein n=1 Tax=Mycobacterium yunnanensis TaxID=368477 RepID=A0A9X2Z6J3_9MYCO|nr:hypothetical protein [Mycobacterium yunnanensis]MCV7423226.1 hypothetical protein [Mycobacterium yunnanensis]